MIFVESAAVSRTATSGSPRSTPTSCAEIVYAPATLAMEPVTIAFAPSRTAISRASESLTEDVAGGCILASAEPILRGDFCQGAVARLILEVGDDDLVSPRERARGKQRRRVSTVLSRRAHRGETAGADQQHHAGGHEIPASASSVGPRRRRHFARHGDVAAFSILGGLEWRRQLHGRRRPI